MLLRLLSLFIIFGLFTFNPVNTYAISYQEETEKKKNEDNKAPTKEAEEDKPAEPIKAVIIKRPQILAPVDALKQKNQDIRHYLTADKVTPMLAGAKDFITIINENTSSNQKGVMILLPDWGMTATSSNALNYLQEILPSQGWTTIAIQPPSRPIGYPSSALMLSLQTEENNKLLSQYQENLISIMTAVMKKAKDYPGIFVVVSKGSHAVLLADLYSSGKLASPSAMVMLSGYMNTETDSLSFAKTLATSEFPVLDLFLSRDNQLANTDANIRKAQATKEMKVYYRQAQLHNIHVGSYPEKQLLRSINGWLKFIGW
jgi:hypothetical protein